MHSKIWKIFALTAVILNITACDNGENNPNQELPESILPCTSECLNETTLRVCYADGTFKDVSCESGCKDRACQRPTVPCIDTCIDQKTLKVCGEDGNSTYQSCPMGCEDASCKTDPLVCDTCHGELLTLCYNNFTFGTQKCPYGCENNACLEVPKCSEDGVFCAGNQLFECREGEHYLSVTCTYGCHDGACAPAPICKHDGSLCYIDQQIVCSDGEIVETISCQSGCQNNQCNPDPECAGENANAVVCSNKMELVTCRDGIVVETSNCMFGCDAQTNACRPNVFGCEQDGDFCIYDGSDEILLTCQDGQITDVINCYLGCKDNACILDMECPAIGSWCEANVLHTCESSGYHHTLTCQSGCENNACKSDPECLGNSEEMATVCLDDWQLGVCQDEVLINGNLTCYNGCNPETNQCYKGPGSCEKDGKFCREDGTIEACENGKYNPNYEDCPFGCNPHTNECILPLDCQTEPEYKNSCIKVSQYWYKIVYCENGSIQIKENCYDATCVTGKEDAYCTYPEDTEFCENIGEITTKCVYEYPEENLYPYVVTQECAVAENGSGVLIRYGEEYCYSGMCDETGTACLEE